MQKLKGKAKSILLAVAAILLVMGVVCGVVLNLNKLHVSNETPIKVKVLGITENVTSGSTVTSQEEGEKTEEGEETENTEVSQIAAKEPKKAVVVVNDVNYASKNHTIRLELDGTDNDKVQNSTLTIDQIVVEVNGTQVSATKSFESGPSDLNDGKNGKKYVLVLTNVQGDGQLSITIPANTLTDATGNKNDEITSTFDTQVIIDNTAPTAPIITNSSNGNWTNTNVTTSFSSTDEAAGVEKYQIKYSGTDNEWQDATNPINWSDSLNETIYFRAIDYLGNISAESTTNIKIDTIVPTATLSVNPTGYAPAIDINIASDGTISNVAKTKWLAGEKTVPDFENAGADVENNIFRVTENGTYTVYVEDEAGNGAVATIAVDKIDKTQPTIEGNNEFNGSSISFTVKDTAPNSTETASGVVGYQITDSETEPTGDWTNIDATTNQEITLSNTALTVGTHYIWVIDAAGNKQKKPITVTYNLTYDYQDNYTYKNAFLDTGYTIDWSKKFRIEETFKVAELGKRYLLFGNYPNKGALHLEVYNNNKIRVYISDSSANSAIIDAKSTETVAKDEDIYLVFEWNPSTKKYTLIARGTTTNITMNSNELNITRKSDATARVGFDYRTDTNTFSKPLNITALKITENITSSEGITTLPTVTKTGYTYNGWFTAATGGTKKTSVTNPTTNSTIYAQKTANALTFENQTINKTFSAEAGSFEVTPAENGTGSYKYEEVSEKKDGTATDYITITEEGAATIAASTPAGSYEYKIKATDKNSGSNATATYTVVIAKETATNIVEITGTATFGKTLTASVSSNSDGTKSYQWYYATSKDATTGTNINGATNSTYKIANVNSTSMVGKFIGCKVTIAEATNYTAHNGATATTATAIAKATPTITFNPTATSAEINYNASASFKAKSNVAGTLTAVSGGENVEITGGASNNATANTEYTIEYKGKAATTSATTITVKITPKDNANYKEATKTFTVSKVNKINASNPTLADVTKEYDGTAHEISVTGGEGGVKKYRTSTDNSTWGEWSTTIPSLTNVGKLYVQAYVEGDDNHIDTSPTESKSITITAKAITSFTLNKTEAKYTGNAITATPTVKAGTISLASTDYDISYSNNKNIGTATATVTAKGNFSGTKTATFTIYYEVLYEKGDNVSGISKTIDKSTNGKVTLPTITPTQGNHADGWYNGNTKVGTAGQENVTVSGNVTLTAKAIANVVTVNIKKDGSAWEESGMKITLYNGTNATDFTATISDSGVSTATFTSVPNGTYNVYASKDSGDKETLINSNVNVTVDNNSPTALEVNYYSLTLVAGAGISEVNNGGTTSTSSITKQYLAITGGTQQLVAINASTKEGYSWHEWTDSGVTPDAYDSSVQMQLIRMMAQPITLTATASFTATPTITRIDHNTFIVSAPAGANYIISKTQTTAPSASTSGWATTSSKNVSTSAKETWYVWVKDASENVSPNSATITNFKVTLTAGTGTKLSVKADTADGDTEIKATPTITKYVLDGTPLYPTGATLEGYNSVVVKKGSTTITNSSKQVISADTTFSSSATANVVTVNIKKDGSAWEESGMKITLYNGTNATDFTATVSDSRVSTATFTAVPNGTYNIYASKDSGDKETLINSNVNVTVDNNSPTAVEVNYYSLTLVAGAGISEVNNGGTTSTSSITKQYLTITGGTQQLVAINANTKEGYSWHEWTDSGVTPDAYDSSVQMQLIRMMVQPITLTATAIDNTAPEVEKIEGGIEFKTKAEAGQIVTLKATDGVGITGYYWGTTEPTAATECNTTTAADLTKITGTGLNKKINAAGTYWFAARDAAGNWDKKPITIVSYTVNDLLEKIEGNRGIYTSENYVSTNIETYIIREGRPLILNKIGTLPKGAGKFTFRGCSTDYSATTEAQPDPDTVPAAENGVTYYMWFDRTTSTVVVSKTQNGSILAETVKQPENYVLAGEDNDKHLTVKYGDTVKADATPSLGYTFKEWSGDYLSGTENPAIGEPVIKPQTISATFIDADAPTLTGNVKANIDSSNKLTFTLDILDAHDSGSGLKGFGVYDNTTEISITESTAESGEVTIELNDNTDWYAKDLVVKAVDNSGNTSTGIPISYYTINSVNGLNGLAACVNSANASNTEAQRRFNGRTVIQTEDITIGTNESLIPIGYRDISNQDNYKYYCFEGTFDGNNKNISNAKFASTFTANGSTNNIYDIGLFGNVKNATIKNVNISLIEQTNTGDYNFANCKAPHMGGIVANSFGNTQIDTCTASGYFSSLIKSSADNVCHIAGICGDSGDSTTIKNCINNANITGTISGENVAMKPRTAGIAGTMSKDGVINNCTNNGHVIGNYITGGIVGYAYGEVSNCTNTNQITDKTSQTTQNLKKQDYTDAIGGIAGKVLGIKVPDTEEVYMGIIKECVNNGGVSSSLVNEYGNAGTGGIVGRIAWRDGAKENIPQVVNVKNTGNIVANNGAGLGGIVGINTGGIVTTGVYNESTKKWTYKRVSGKGENTGSITGNGKNDTPEADDTEGAANIGGICGMNLGGEISYYINTGNVVAGQNAGGHIGGIVGSNKVFDASENLSYEGVMDADKRANLTYCSNRGSVKGMRQVGGICGINYRDASEVDSLITANVYWCSNTQEASVEQTGTGDHNYLGGIVGCNYGGIISYSYNATEIQSYKYGGGIAGVNKTGGRVQYCYSNSASYSGYGLQSAPTICWLVGFNETGAATSNLVYVGRKAPDQSGVPNVAAKVEEELKTMCGTKIWVKYFKVDVGEHNNGYPVLKWEYDENINPSLLYGAYNKNLTTAKPEVTSGGKVITAGIGGDSYIYVPDGKQLSLQASATGVKFYYTDYSTDSTNGSAVNVAISNTTNTSITGAGVIVIPAGKSVTFTEAPNIKIIK